MNYLQISLVLLVAIIHIYIMPDKQGRHMIFSHVEIILYQSSCMFCEIDNPYLASLSTYRKLSRFEVDIVFVQSCEFADTKAS